MNKIGLKDLILSPRNIYNAIYALRSYVFEKGLMTESDLEAIHAKLMTAVPGIDKIYHCSKREYEHSFMRKPSIGMAIQARREHPGLRLKECVMVGDSMTDMLFGRRAGMTTVLVGDNSDCATAKPWLVDYRYKDLFDFARSL